MKNTQGGTMMKLQAFYNKRGLITAKNVFIKFKTLYPCIRKIHFFVCRYITSGAEKFVSSTK